VGRRNTETLGGPAQPGLLRGSSLAGAAAAGSPAGTATGLARPPQQPRQAPRPDTLPTRAPGPAQCAATNLRSGSGPRQGRRSTRLARLSCIGSALGCVQAAASLPQPRRAPVAASGRAAAALGASARARSSGCRHRSKCGRRCTSASGQLGQPQHAKMAAHSSPPAAAGPASWTGWIPDFAACCEEPSGYLASTADVPSRTPTSRQVRLGDGSCRRAGAIDSASFLLWRSGRRGARVAVLRSREQAARASASAAAGCCHSISSAGRTAIARSASARTWSNALVFLCKKQSRRSQLL
jgi:hypothetical protein